MIAETLIASAAFLASVFGLLRFEERRHKRELEWDSRDPKAMRAAIAEKPRVLERDRGEWLATARNGAATLERRDAASRAMSQIDRQLLALADKESKLPPENA